MTEKFEILSPRAHCRLRPQMWIGSTSKEEIEQFVLGKWKPAKCVPALSKMVDEIVSNSVDENGRSLGKFANKIDISVKNECVEITDNGRGIPQDEITDTNTGEKLLRPVAAWTRTNAGTSFGENRTTIGAHGLGSALVNFMSTEFIGKTWRDGNLMEIHCTDGGLNIEVKQKKQSGNGTSVTFTPDFSLFEVNSLSELDTIELIEDRLMGLQLCFPEIAFSFNKERVKSTDLKKYSELFVADGASVIIEKSDNLSFFFCASVDGFRTNSFINGVNTRQGGTYVDYVVNCVVEELLILIKKKHKIEVGKSVLKNGLTFILFARNFVNPKFDSQTKERLTNPVSNVKEHVETSGIHDFKYIAKKLFAADDIIQPIIAAQIAKKNADDYRDALVAQKKLKKVKVAKHIAATSPNANLFITEGDCIEENTIIHVLDGDKKIKDIQVGDYVLTHKNRYKVISRNFALKNGININGIIYSPSHRLYVYNKNLDIFEFIPTKEINKEIHKLVRNRLVYNGIYQTLNEVIDIKKSNIVHTDKQIIKFSDLHEILYMNEKLEICSKTIKQLKKGDIILL